MAGVGSTHHLKLGNEFLIIRPNSYTKTPAPTFGARIATGDPDYNNLSIWQHWVQKCWVGGMGADEWVDDAMFIDACGIDTTRHERASLSRHLVRGSTPANWGLGSGADPVTDGRFHIYKGVLYALHEVAKADSSGVSRLYKYTPATQAWASVSLPATFMARSLTTFDGKMFIGGSVDDARPAGTGQIYWATTPGTWTPVTTPASATQGVHVMKEYNSKLYVAYGNQVWRLKDDETWDGSTVFYAASVNSESNYIDAMEIHLSFLYMLSQNGHLHRTDGNNTFDIWSWDGQTAGVSLRSYDGKLFVGTYEWTDTIDIGYGVLYQFTGAAVTELKRWGRDNKATAMGQMIVYGRKLYYGASSLFGVRGGFGVACYDVVEDGHSLFAIQDDTSTYPDTTGTGKDWIVDDLIVFGGKLFVLNRKYGVFFTEDSFQDVQLNRAQYTTSTTGGVLTSSVYDGGTPGLLKLWRKIIVWADLAASGTSLILAYSTNGGTSWTTMTTLTGPTTTSQHVFNLNNIQATRFQYRITMKTTNEVNSPVLRGISVAYLPQPEPNWMWSFTIPVADKWELMDGTVETKSTNALIAALEAMYRSGALVSFIDIDGVSWATSGPGVLLYDMSTVHYDVESPREADVRITLLEAVESY